MIDMGQQFRGRTLLRPLVDASFVKSELLQKLKSAAEYVDGTLSIEGEIVKFNDPGFDRYFMVHATDPSAARVFLTPELRKRLADLRQKHGLPLRASFTGTKAYLAVHHAEMFEASAPKRRGFFPGPEVFRGAAACGADHGGSGIGVSIELKGGAVRCGGNEGRPCW